MHLFGRPLDWEALQSAVSPELVAARGRGRRARRALAGMPCGGLGAAGLPLVPSAQDRHDRRGRSGDHDDAELADVDPAPSPPRLSRTPTATSPRPGPNYRLSGRPLRARDPAAPPARRVARRREADRGRLLGAARGRRRHAGRRRGRPPWLAGVRHPGRPARRGPGDAAGGGDRGPDRNVCAAPVLAPTRDQGPFPGADRAFERALALPFHSRLSEGELGCVAEFA